MSDKESLKRATKADKIALGVGAAASLGVAAGLYMAKKASAAKGKYSIGDGSRLMKDYWRVDYIKDNKPQTRFFLGTEAAVQRRLKHYRGEVKLIQKLDQASAQSQISEQKAHLVKL
ncbi:MAG: hypothetical protein GX119_10240 [Syntrophomonadaceae bacterium]|jgi:hypothetical protein|nr:hypothetical protein [Syntrophomonadaceae bacterium]